jgi:E3 ubiquitin-protein ligase DOA10
MLVDVLKHLYKIRELYENNFQKETFQKINSKDNSDFENTEICRLCFEPEGNFENIFLNPCKCIGSMKWIHKRCLLESIEILESDICTVCKYQYKTTEFKHSKLYRILCKYKEQISKYLSYGVIILITLLFRFGFLKKKRILNKTYTSIKFTCLIIMSIHITICIFKMLQYYIQNSTILFNLNDFILIGDGHMFNTYFILKYYIDIGLDRIKTFSKPSEAEYVNM